MYRFLRFLRILLTLLIVGAVIAAVGFYIYSNNFERASALYNTQATSSVQTAIAEALFDATRTVEAPIRQYRLIALEPGDTLTQIAAEYDTTPEIIRRVNGLSEDVESGNGEIIIVPEGLQTLDPPRRLRTVKSRIGDTLSLLAESYGIPLELIEIDNPILAARGLMPGDTVFIAVLMN